MVEYDKMEDPLKDEDCYMGVALKFNVDRAIPETAADKIDKTLGHAWIHGRDPLGINVVKGARTSLNYIERNDMATITYIFSHPRDITAEHLMDLKMEVGSKIALDLEEVQVQIIDSKPPDARWFTVS